MADWGINPQFIGGRPARPEWMNPKGLEQPWLDPVELLAGVGGAARIVGKKALAGLVPDILGGVAAESVADRESTWAPLAANVAANIVAGKMLDPARLAELRELAPRVLNNERGMFTPPTAEDMQRLARMAAGEDVEAPRVFSALHDRMPRVEIDDSGAVANFSNLTASPQSLGESRIKKIQHEMETITKFGDKSLLPRFRQLQSDLEEARQLRAYGFGEEGQRGLRAEEIIDHPSLYESVPTTRNIRVVPDSGGVANNTLGGYSGTHDLLTINPLRPEEMQPTLLHELQHAVQERGGFARGGSPQQFDDAVVKAQAGDEYDLLWETMQANPENREKILPLLDSLRTLRRGGAQEQYRRLAGEIEARDTAARMNLSDISRASTQPYSGYAVRPDGSFGPTYEQNPIRLEDFIVRRDGGPAMSLPYDGAEFLHGTNAVFDEFYDKPTYFTTRPEYGYIKKSNNIKRANLDITNPKMASTQSEIEQARSNPELIDELRTSGYDALVWHKDGDITRGRSGWGDDYPQFLVFSNKQIKPLAASSR